MIFSTDLYSSWFKPIIPTKDALVFMCAVLIFYIFNGYQLLTSVGLKNALCKHSFGDQASKCFDDFLADWVGGRQLLH